MAYYYFSGCSDNYEFVVPEEEILVSVSPSSFWYFSGSTDSPPYNYSACVFLTSSAETSGSLPIYSGVSLTYYGDTDCESCINDNEVITPMAGDLYYIFSSCCESGLVFEVNELEIFGNIPSVGITFYLTGKTPSSPFLFVGCADLISTADTSSIVAYTEVELIDGYDTCVDCLAVYPCASPTPTPTQTKTPTPTPTTTTSPTPTPTTSPTPTNLCDIISDFTFDFIPTICDCYTVFASKDTTYSYVDCNGVVFNNVFLATNNSVRICVSIVPTGDFIELTNEGVCFDNSCPDVTSSPTPTPTPTPTVSSTSFPTPTPTSSSISPLSVSCPISGYCLNLENTSYSGFTDYYVNSGLFYNNYNYFVGQITGYFIYYSITNLSWCLSDTLGGTCFLFGQSPCENICPDLDESYASEGVCPTPTPTQTQACFIDFDVLFNCDFIPTPTQTPTITSTPTNTPTPTQTVVCLVGIDVEISNVSPTPTSTPTPTPSNAPQGQCEIFGQAIYESLNGFIVCDDVVNWFTDCESGQDYYTVSPAVFNGNPLTVLNVYSGVIDFGPYNETKCLIFKGVIQSETVGPIITISSEHGTDCLSCIPVPPPSQTPSLTPSITPTKTTTPTPSTSFSNFGYKRYFVYKNCTGNEYFVQPVETKPNGVQLLVGEVFGWSLVPIFNPLPSGYFERYTCWRYLGSYYGLINGVTAGGGPQWGGLIPTTGAGIRTGTVDYFTTYVISIGYPNAGFNPNSPFKGTGNNDQCAECCSQPNTVCSTVNPNP